MMPKCNCEHILDSYVVLTGSARMHTHVLTVAHIDTSLGKYAFVSSVSVRGDEVARVGIRVIRRARGGQEEAGEAWQKEARGGKRGQAGERGCKKERNTRNGAR
jgi:hypothetical protein